MIFREAKSSENSIPTQISFESKAYWNSPNAFFDVWADELTITTDDIQRNDVVVVEQEDVVVGYYSIVERKDDLDVSGIPIGKELWLEYMFVEPSSIEKRR